MSRRFLELSQKYCLSRLPTLTNNCRSRYFCQMVGISNSNNEALCMHLVTNLQNNSNFRLYSILITNAYSGTSVRRTSADRLSAVAIASNQIHTINHASLNYIDCVKYLYSIKYTSVKLATKLTAKNKFILHLDI